MKRIFVHAGPGKTGSSAIQYWLNAHASSLEEQGVLYPSHSTDANGVSSGNRDVVMDRTAEGGFVANPTKMAELLSELQSGSCHTLLLSSEFFFQSIREIRSLVPDALFVVYIRDPIEIAESGYNQAVKRHGRTNAFVLPPRFRSGVLTQLDAMLRSDEPPRLVVRPYAEDLFVGGSIVSDLCSVLGVEGEVGDRERVNPSYTFEALEFMRHANHFPLGNLAEPLDRALQACSVGEREYSLVPEARYAEVRANVLAQLRELVDRHGLASLNDMVQHLEAKERRPFRRQQATPEQLAAVADYLRATAPDLLRRLVRRVRESPAAVLPSEAFYAILDVRPAHAPSDA